MKLILEIAFGPKGDPEEWLKEGHAIKVNGQRGWIGPVKRVGEGRGAETLSAEVCFYPPLSPATLALLGELYPGEGRA